MPASSLDQVVSLCKRRGFIYPGSAIYGGLANSWDYGPLGVELARNVKQQWWEAMVYRRDDIEGLDSGIILNRKVWKYSGHEGGFNDPLVDNKESKKRYRLDHLLEAQSAATLQKLVELIRMKTKASEIDTAPDKLINGLVHALFDLKSSAGELLTQAKIVDPETDEPGNWTEPRQFNMMFSTQFGVTADEENKVYLRPETAQGIFVNFKHVAETSRRKPPFGVAQIGKSFRNEITPGNFIFRTREFEQMEMEFFIPPPPYAEGERTDDEWHAHWVNERFNWYTDLGVSPERLRKHNHPKEVLSHYSKATTDIEYRFPGSLGFAELEGIANRSDFDLTAHSREVPNNTEARERLKLPPNPDSVENLTFFDQEKKQHIVPWVIEPAVGVARPMLVFLCEAFAIELVDELPEADAKRAGEQLAAYLKSVEKSENLDDGDKKAIV
ncbi:MAG: glycine--tRNA ligase, partial [Planctomycetes bacterium]|nr:glycine--tRNA ligase [Planctomycetota bacterium]